MKEKRITIPDIQKRKNKDKIVMLTAYDYIMASILDKAGVDIILVGDSVGTVMLGYANTLPVSLEDILHHTKAVSNGVKRALVIGDMPFGSYQASMHRGLESGIALIKAGAHGIKIEGSHHCSLIREFVHNGIPVMGHVGLTPQFIHIMGGYRVQGKKSEQKARLIEEAKRLEDNGVFSIVIEGVPSSVAAAITQAVKVPTIGIGAGPECDGQVLVITDMLGMDDTFQPRFVKKYANLSTIIREAVLSYADDVKTGRFPGPEHCYPERKKA